MENRHLIGPPNTPHMRDRAPVLWGNMPNKRDRVPVL